MRDCPEIEELLKKAIGDEVVGFFEKRLISSMQEVRVYIPVYAQNTKPEGFVN